MPGAGAGAGAGARARTASTTRRKSKSGSTNTNTNSNAKNGNILYQDDNICIVRRGGIPVYTAVGYLETPNTAGAAHVCETGLKTYQKLAGELELGSGLNKDRAFYREKNSHHLQYIFFRAPMCWPFTLEDGILTPRSSLKGTALRDFYFNQSVSEIMSRVNKSGARIHALIEIRVDPKKTRVYNAFLRTLTDTEKSDIVDSSLRLDQYMIMLRERGALEYEGEILAMPKDGLLPPNTFQHCWTVPPASEPNAPAPFRALFQKAVGLAGRRQSHIRFIRNSIYSIAIALYSNPKKSLDLSEKHVSYYNVIQHINTHISPYLLHLTTRFDMSAYEASYFAILFTYCKILAEELFGDKEEATLTEAFGLVLKTLASIVHQKAIERRLEGDVFDKVNEQIESITEKNSEKYDQHIGEIEEALKKRVGHHE